MEQVQPNKAFFWGILLNLIYIIAEVAFGIGIGSVALVADAIHNMSDVLGLGLAWFAEWLSIGTRLSSVHTGIRVRRF